MTDVSQLPLCCTFIFFFFFYPQAEGVQTIASVIFQFIQLNTTVFMDKMTCGDEFCHVYYASITPVHHHGYNILGVREYNTPNGIVWSTQKAHTKILYSSNKSGNKI